MFRLPPLTPFVRKLLYTLAAVFLVTALAENFMRVEVIALLALNTRDVSSATLWQVFTNVLVQSPTSVFPLLINLLFIWLILPPFEERYGSTRVIQLALLGTVCSSAMALLSGQLLPGYAGHIEGPGPITLAAMSAYAVLLPPHAEVSLFGVVPVRSQQLLWVVLGLSVLGFLTTRNVTALASDLGAIGAGIAFIKWWLMRVPRRRTFHAKPSKLHVIRRDSDRSRPN